MVRLALCGLVVFLISLCAPRPGLAQDRFALIVGINKYQNLNPLQKADNDARALAPALARIGFKVDLALDVDRRAFNKALSDFLNKITPGAIVYFHYSGHGVSIDNDTYLIPADMEVPTSADREFVKREAIRLSELIDSFKNAKARSRVLVIDACRDNPFAERGVRSIGTGHGIALLPAPEGTLILYSAADGQTALDSLGPNDTDPTSVYTRTLLKHLTTPGVSIVQVARDVRHEVEDLAKTVGHDQRPSYYDELSDELVLTPGNGAPIASVPPPLPVPPPQIAALPPVPPAVAAVPASRPPAPDHTVFGALPGVDFPGSDLRSIQLATPDPGLCQNACRAEAQCAAWTYVKPGEQGPEARCWLKNKIVQPTASACCTSGIERAAAAVNAMQPGINLLGSDFRSLDLATPDPALCQSTCQSDARCVAWTYVKPGTQGPQARCWLKNKIPRRSANACCTSGIERPQ